MADWLPAHIHLGLSYGLYREYEGSRPNEVVLPTVETLDVRRAGLPFRERLLVGGPEQGWSRWKRENPSGVPPGLTNQLPEISPLTYT